MASPPDTSYPHSGTGVYWDNDGKRLVIGTTGEIVCGTTNGVTITSSGITIGSSDNATITTDGLVLGTSGYVQQSVTAPSTAASALGNRGVSTIRSTTAAGAQIFHLSAPIIGVTKTIICTQANNTDTCTVSAGTAVSISNTTVVGTNLYKFIAPGAVQLIGITTAVWGILTPNVSTVAYSTS